MALRKKKATVFSHYFPRRMENKPTQRGGGRVGDGRRVISRGVHSRLILRALVGKLAVLITPSFATILVAAGRSARMGFDKLAAPLEGRPVLAHSLATFLSHPGMRLLVLVGPEERCVLCAEFLGPHAGRWIGVPGGATRADSVLAGLEALAARPDIEPGILVAVHDAARPLLSRDMLDRALEVAAERGNAVCAEPLTDTIHRTGTEGVLEQTMDRSGWWRMQTPQIFPLGELREVLRASALEEATDEAGAFLRAGRRVYLSPTPEPNWKITTPTDLALARAWLRESSPAGSSTFFAS
jgi:2-C-methyl-D-erythritol 4-phosphate cytidylyltransferase